MILTPSQCENSQNETPVDVEDKAHVRCTCMKQVTATQARQNFFKLLDCAARGEKIVIERKGVSLELVRQPTRKGKRKSGKIPDYSNCIFSDVSNADKWTWEWEPGENDLRFIDRSQNTHNKSD